MSIKETIVGRIRIAFVLVVVVVVFIIGRVIYLQLVEGNKWQEVSEEYGLQYKTIRATRGNIYAEGGELLATSVPLYKVSIDPVIIPDSLYKKDLDSLCVLLADFFEGQEATEYRRKIHNARRLGKRYVVLNPNGQFINYQDKKRMSKWPLFREGRQKGGVIFEKVHKRSYPYEHLAERLVGYVNDEDLGVVGLEKSFDKPLAGTEGKALFRKISGGDWKPVSNASRMMPDDGYDIYTTINVNIQEIATEALREGLVANEANYGCAIVMEVATGEVKALVNLGRNDEGQYIENYNYAVGEQGKAEPGSTFKLPSLLAVLEDSELSLSDTIQTGGGAFRFADQVMRDPRYGGFGNITVQQAFAYSSSIGISRLVTRHFNSQPERFWEYMFKFGLTEPMGVQIDGEAKPYIKEPNDATWSGTTLPWTSIGYETQIAPIHTLAFYNAIANKGKMITPLLVKEIRQANNLIERFEPIVLNEKIVSDSTLIKARVLLESVVQLGTARNLRNAKFKIAGKTGTSQKIENGRYVKKYYASFVGYFPAERPRYTCIVVVDEPKYNQYGADAAAPIFKVIANKLYVRDLAMQKSLAAVPQNQAFQLKIPSSNVSNVIDVDVLKKFLNIPSAIAQDADWVVPMPQKMQVNWEKRNILANSMPNVIGMTLRDALYILENKGLRVFYDGQGRVKSQSVMPGANLPSNKRVVLNLY